MWVWWMWYGDAVLLDVNDADADTDVVDASNTVLLDSDDVTDDAFSVEAGAAEAFLAEADADSSFFRVLILYLA